MTAGDSTGGKGSAPAAAPQDVMADSPSRTASAAVREAAGRTAVERRAVPMGRLLYVSAAWTLTIKYALPVAWALRVGAPLTSYIFFWDAWWAAHLAVGWGLVRIRRGVWVWAVLLALVEIPIIAVKLALFLWNPVFDFWRANWFVNKCWLLAYFAFSMYWLTRPEVKARLKSDDAEPSEARGPEPGDAPEPEPGDAPEPEPSDAPEPEPSEALSAEPFPPGSEESGR